MNVTESEVHVPDVVAAADVEYTAKHHQLACVRAGDVGRSWHSLASVENDA